MSHFAVIAPPLFSHFRALESLAQALSARCYRVTFFQRPEARSLLTDSRISAGGASRAAEIVVRALNTRCPVIAELYGS